MTQAEFNRYRVIDKAITGLLAVAVIVVIIAGLAVS